MKPWYLRAFLWLFSVVFHPNPLKHLSHLALPKLWTPKAAQFFAVDELPYLASGKLDLRKVRETAAQFSQSCEPEPKEVVCT